MQLLVRIIPSLKHFIQSRPNVVCLVVRAHHCCTVDIPIIILSDLPIILLVSIS